MQISHSTVITGCSWIPDNRAPMLFSGVKLNGSPASYTMSTDEETIEKLKNKIAAYESTLNKLYADGRLIPAELVINDPEIIRGRTLPQILTPHKITHLRYRAITIRAGIMREYVKISYPNDLTIKYLCRWEEHTVSVKVDERRGEITSRDGCDDMEAKVDSDARVLRICRGGKGYNIMINDNREVISRDADSAILRMGDYEFVMSLNQYEEDRVILNNINEDYRILKTANGNAPIIRLDETLSFDCYDGQFVNTK